MTSSLSIALAAGLIHTTTGQAIPHGAFDKNIFVLDMDVFLELSMSETYRRLRELYPDFKLNRTLVASTPNMFAVGGSASAFQGIPDEREVVPAVVCNSGDRWGNSQSKPTFVEEDRVREFWDEVTTIIPFWHSTRWLQVRISW